jgi:hypothetical protein
MQQQKWNFTRHLLLTIITVIRLLLLFIIIIIIYYYYLLLLLLSKIQCITYSYWARDVIKFLKSKLLILQSCSFSFVSIGYFAFEIENFESCDSPGLSLLPKCHKNQYFYVCFRLSILINIYK